MCGLRPVVIIHQDGSVLTWTPVAYVFCLDMAEPIETRLTARAHSSLAIKDSWCEINAWGQELLDLVQGLPTLAVFISMRLLGV